MFIPARNLRPPAQGKTTTIDLLPYERLAARLQRPRNLHMPLAYRHINRIVQNRFRHADIAMMLEQPIHIFRAPQRNHPYQHPSNSTLSIPTPS